jgi:hypothetical protein
MKKRAKRAAHTGIRLAEASYPNQRWKALTRTSKLPTTIDHRGVGSLSFPTQRQIINGFMY